jgi:hypothetical protein
MERENYLELMCLHLSRIADSLEILSRPGKDYSPDYVMPIGEFAGFDWGSVNITVVRADRDGPTHLQWNGQVYTRRSPSNKFDPAIWYSRASGKSEDGETEYTRLITFREIKDADPLGDKTRAVVDRNRPQQPTNGTNKTPAPAANGATKQQPAPSPSQAPAPTTNSAVKPLASGELVSYTEYMRRAKAGNITAEAAMWIAQQIPVKPEDDHSVPASYLQFFYNAKHAGFKLSEAWSHLKESGFDTEAATAKLPPF